MKILLTTDCYSPVINGVVTSVLNLRKELLHRGHDVKVLTLSQTPRSFTREGVTYIGSVGAGRVYPDARVKRALTRSYVQEIIKWKPDIIHSHCEFSTFFLAKRIARKLEIPIIHTYHTVYEDYTHYFSPNQKWGRHMAAILSRWVLNSTDCVIAPTEKVRSILTGYKINPEIRVIPTGIDLSDFTTATKTEELLNMKLTLGIPRENRVLLYVGRLAKEKNLEEILISFANMDLKNVTLLIVGDGPYRGTLEQMSKELGLEESLVFAGMIKAEDISDYYHLGDLFVSASSSETQGLTYIEALASGIPTLCKKDDCLNDVIINGENGWQYESEDDFSEKLNIFLNNKYIYNMMSHGSSQIAMQKFSLATFADKAESTYTDVLNRIS